ncbi:MAG: hypothetical protein HZB51_10715 [Chloroflexi bacterium]|nr:hypothetical protein [Chloroflexota bacterium]
MADLDKLVRRVEHPEFAKAYKRNKVKAVEDTVGRPLTAQEQEGVKALSHTKLKQVIKALRPRKAGPHPPE